MRLDMFYPPSTATIKTNLEHAHSFVAQAGSGIKASDQRKNCQLNVKIRYPSGWQFSVFKADYRGYANLPKGATRTCKATYYFSGDQKQVRLSGLIQSLSFSPRENR